MTVLKVLFGCTRLKKTAGFFFVLLRPFLDSCPNKSFFFYSAVKYPGKAHLNPHHTGPAILASSIKAAPQHFHSFERRLRLLAFAASRAHTWASRCVNGHRLCNKTVPREPYKHRSHINPTNNSLPSTPALLLHWLLTKRRPSFS